VELNALSLAAILVAFVAGALAGWFLRQPKTVAVAPPDLEREKTLAEARHEGLIDDIEQHLNSTHDALTALAARQAKLASELRGDSSVEVLPEPNDTDAIMAPKDYSEARGQLS